MISGGRGGTHPASHKAYPAYHNEYSLSVNHSLISPLYTIFPPKSCLPGDSLAYSQHYISYIAPSLKVRSDLLQKPDAVIKLLLWYGLSLAYQSDFPEEG